jgi:hypothetical protein
MNGDVSSRDWAAPPRFALLLAALIFVPFWKVLLGFDTFVVRDFGLFSYPVAAFQRECFWRGEWPLWNPYNCCGLPFLAQFNTLALYPLSLVYLLLPLAWSLSAFCLLHVFLAGLGMYFLARRWTGSQAGAALAGVVFAFNGLTLNFLMWPSHIATFAWMPWVIWLVEEGWRRGGRKIILAALAAALEVLAGGPETILFTWLLLLALAGASCARQPGTAWRTARRLAGMGWLALGLAAAQLLPFVDLALHCSRTSHYGNSAWAMPPWGWGNFLVPLFQTSQWQQIAVQRGQSWTSSYYAGIGTVFLAGIALWRGRRNWRVWLLGGFLLASLVLALGNDGFLFPWLRRWLPFLGLFRYPVKFIILTLAVLPLLAACALAHYESRPAGDWRGWRLDWLWGAALLLLTGAVLGAARLWPVEGASWPATAANGLWRMAFLVLTLLALHLFVRRPRWRGWSIAVLLAAIWLDLLTHEPWQNPTVAPSVYQPGLARTKVNFAPAPDIAQSRLMMSPFAARQLYYKPSRDVKANFLLDRVVFLADCNLLDGLPKVDGFFSLYVRESDKVLWLLDARTGRKLDSLEDLLSVSRTIAPGKVFDWVPRANYIPIVSAGQAPLFAAEQAAFDAIALDAADFRKVVYLPPEAKSSVRAVREPRARIVAKEFAATRENIEVETPAPATVVLCQACYHDWQARVDGAAVPLWRANYAFQAIEVPAGKHRITLIYKDMAFQAGGVISTVALLICLVGWVLLKREAEDGKTA